jgi:histidinol-phosphate aminotransferase
MTMRPISQLVRPHLRRLEPYVPGVQPSGSGWIKLNTNELPFPPPAAVQQAIAEEAGKLARYPNPRSDNLRQALADRHGLNHNQVIVGNGSDDLLNLLARAFGGPRNLTSYTLPSYSLYTVLAAIADGEVLPVEFGADFSLPVKQLAGCGAHLIFLTCPNAPTGVRFPLADLQALADTFDGLLVIDEAYAEFAAETALPLLQQHENVVITRTFSKAYGLAGLRVGYAMAAPAVIAVLDRIRDSYNVNRLSQAGALAALAEADHYRDCINRIRRTRDAVRRELLELGWQVFPSEANFLFAQPADGAGHKRPDVAKQLFKHLEAARILVRYFPRHPLTASGLRISVGTEDEMRAFMQEVKRWINNA